MVHSGVRKPEDAALYWDDELRPNFGKYDLVDTEAKPNFGKGKKHRHAHKMEQELPKFAAKAREKYGEGKKPALVLDFARIGEDKFAVINSGVFFIVQKAANSKKWEAQASFRAWKTPIFEADDPASALTRLVHFDRWFCHRQSMEWWSLGKLYRNVHFILPFGKRKRMPAKGTFDRELSSCNHVVGRFAWNPAEPRTTRPPEPKKVYKPAPIPHKTKSWPKFNDAKYVVVNGVLELRSNWQAIGTDDGEYVGRI